MQLGSRVTLNEGAPIQGHSLEDGVFKSDYIRIGNQATIEPGAVIHYGTVVDNPAAVAPDSFLMKGDHMPAGVRWMGNPAWPVVGATSTVPPNERRR